MQSIWALLSNFRMVYAVAGMSLAAGIFHLSVGRVGIGLIVLAQFAFLAWLAGWADKDSEQDRTREARGSVFAVQPVQFTLH